MLSIAVGPNVDMFAFEQQTIVICDVDVYELCSLQYREKLRKEVLCVPIIGYSYTVCKSTSIERWRIQHIYVAYYFIPWTFSVNNCMFVLQVSTSCRR